MSLTGLDALPLSPEEVVLLLMENEVEATLAVSTLLSIVPRDLATHLASERGRRLYTQPTGPVTFVVNLPPAVSFTKHRVECSVRRNAHGYLCVWLFVPLNGQQGVWRTKVLAWGGRSPIRILDNRARIAKCFAENLTFDRMESSGIVFDGPEFAASGVWWT